MRSRHLASVLLVVATLIGAAAGAATGAGAAPDATADTAPATGRAGGIAGRRVLLTNDDSVQAANSRGTDGRGLYELRRALCAAGADVVTVGPWGQQSGSGARVTTPGSAAPLTVQPVTAPASYQGDCSSAPSEGRVYGVCQAAAPCGAGSPSASPADTVLVALARFVPDNVWADGPDLVVSGTNFGQNAGEAVNHSGTVGAAVTALESHVPALAVSAEFDPACRPDPFACVPFADAGTFTARLVDRLDRRGLLRPDTALNVNYPVVGAGETLGDAVVAVVGTGTNLPSAYAGTVTADGGTYTVEVGTPAPETRPDADTTALARNDIPVTALDGDWTAAGRTAALRSALRGLA